jgi:Lanthionine synthetase C-like protein
MSSSALYEPAEFESLIDEPWVPARVVDAIAAIVSDTDAAFDQKLLWPAYDWDAREQPLPLQSLYAGAAGVIWALDELRRRGHAETSLDLVAAASRTLELKRARPDFAWDEHYHPASLFCGETGPLLVAYRLAPDPALAADLLRLVRENVANPTDDISWGLPGSLLAALAMHEWTAEQRWLEAARETAGALRARRGEDGLWRQDDDYRGFTAMHGAAGNTLALLRFEPDDAFAGQTAAVLARHAFRDDGLANWPGTPRPQLARPRDGRICVQFCTGAPGVLAGSWEYLDEELVLAGAGLVWRAGAHPDEKGHGLCHGTAGNGFALLEAFARTGDERWLERARRFAVHALAQAERIAVASGRRYSLFTGDVGTALFAAACLDVDVRYPIIDVI